VALVRIEGTRVCAFLYALAATLSCVRFLLRFRSSGFVALWPTVTDIVGKLFLPRFNPRCVVVEAAGVEPASENVTGQETTCLVQFMLPAFTGNVRGRRSERTRNAYR
jgi:hypothetical protein